MLQNQRTLYVVCFKYILTSTYFSKFGALSIIIDTLFEKTTLKIRIKSCMYGPKDLIIKLPIGNSHGSMILIFFYIVNQEKGTYLLHHWYWNHACKSTR